MMGRNQGSDPIGDMFSEGAAMKPSLDSETFREKIVEAYPEAVDVRDAIRMAVDDAWTVGLDGDEPVRREDEFEGLEPSYRENQREAVIDILANLYVADKDVVTLSAPTGAGKSLILHGALSVVRDVFGADGFFTTPLNALIDQVEGDEFMEPDVVTLKGKNNYQCVHRQDRGTPVDKAVCQRVDDFECEHKDQSHENGGCPYYGRKAVAKKHPEVVTNMSYLMANSMIPDEHAIPPKEIMVVDECQKIEDFALQFVSVIVSKRTIPLIWDQIGRPPRSENVEDLRQWLQQEVARRVSDKLREFEGRAELSEEEADKRDKLKEFLRKVENFLTDSREHHWVAETEFDDDDWKVKFNPIKVGRFLDKFLWSQGEKVILSSATIPRGGFLEEIGLDDCSVGEIEVESTFPPERRPIYTDYTVGKMTMNERDRTIPKMASKIAALARHHDGERGFIHCHSYGIAKRLYKHLPNDVKGRARVQNQKDREESLDAWLRADVDEDGGDNPEIGGQVFLSVAMDEGISLDYDRARWQVVAKAAYPFMGDKRVDYRLNELNDWTWYAGSAAINLQQAVGRGMRAKDDYCHTYVLDTSAADLIDRNEYLFEEWFLDAVDVEGVEGDRA